MNNTIKIILTEFGGIQVVSIPLKLYKDSYKVVNIECLLPKTTNKKSILKMYASGRDNLGNKVWTSQTYNLPYEKDIIHNQEKHELYRAMLPEEFCKVNGHLEITFAHLELTEQDAIERLLTSGTINLYIDGVGSNNAGVAISPYDITASKVNQLVKDMDTVQNWTAEDIPLLESGRLPYENVQEALNALQEEKADRKQVDKELERLEGKLDTGIDQEEVERNVIKEVVSLINKETIGIDKVDNTADMDKPVSTLQQEAITEATDIAKAELQKEIDNSIVSVEVEDKTGIFTFTKHNGDIFTVNTLLEKVIVNFWYDNERQSLILESEDGTQQEIPIDAFLSTYQGSDGAEIAVTVDRNNNIGATIKAGAITEQKLSLDLLDRLEQMQAQITYLQNQIREDKENWLDKHHPVKEYYYCADKDFDPNVAWGGKWILMPANAGLWSKGTENIDFEKIKITVEVDGELETKDIDRPKLIDQSLPNIGGSVTIRSPWTGASQSGALKTYSQREKGVGGQWDQDMTYKLEFDASKSNTTYGRSQYVRQPSYGAYIWYRYE